jgi:ABC-type oligopeptide transport system substrate-binding subunit
LLKSGDPDGSKTKNLTYYYDSNNNPLFVASATFLQDQWQTNLGVHVNIQAVTHGSFMQARGGGQYTFSRGGWLADYNSPEDWYDGGFGKNGGCPASKTCVSGYTSAAFDQLASQANVLPTDQALPIYKKMAQMLIDDVAYIPLMYHNGAFLIKPYVKGAGSNSFYDYYWNEFKIMSH